MIYSVSFKSEETTATFEKLSWKIFSVSLYVLNSMNFLHLVNVYKNKNKYENGLVVEILVK